MKKLFLTTALASALATASVAEVSNKARMSAQIIQRDAIVSSQSAQGSSAPAMWVILVMLALVAYVGATTGGGGGHYGYNGHHAVSDLNLKTDVRRVGTSAQGFGIYQFRYRGHEQVFEGAVAQDVLKRLPGAVSQTRDGVLMVDYAQIDVVPKLIR